MRTVLSGATRLGLVLCTLGVAGACLLGTACNSSGTGSDGGPAEAQTDGVTPADAKPHHDSATDAGAETGEVEAGSDTGSDAGPRVCVFDKDGSSFDKGCVFGP